MTAEAIVLNKSAVAMAADSAVTVSGGPIRAKTYDTANKLFELVKGCPVGIMVYANAQINGIPWETVIKGYRADRKPHTLPFLSDYVDEFEQYIRTNADMFPESTNSFTVLNSAYSALLPIFEYYRENLERCITSKGKIVKSQARKVIDDAISAAEEGLDGLEYAQWALDGGLDYLKEVHLAQIRNLIKDRFAEFQLPAKSIQILVDIAVNYVTKVVDDPTETGIVSRGSANANTCQFTTLPP